MRLLSLSYMLALGVAGTSQAQTNASLAPSDGADSAMAAPNSDDGDIVVTAQRRSERLVNVPITITSNKAETIERAAVNGLVDLAKVTPGLVTNRFGIAVQPAIRGVTTRLGENSVATYVDGFYIPSAIGLNFDFNGISQVDVLKGPQGTLFGRNATGGAIVITTRQPTSALQINSEASVEGLGGLRLATYVSGALANDLNADLALLSRTSDGYIRNVGSDAPINNTVQRNIRGRLVWQPSDQATLSLTGEYGYVEDATTAASFTFYRNRLLPGPTERNVISANHEPENQADWRAIYLKGTFELGGATLTSYSSYRHEKNDLDVDLDGSATSELVNIRWQTTQRTYQQEFNLASAGSGRLTWVAGLFYFNDNYRRDDIPGNIVIAPTTAQILTTTEAGSIFGDVTFAATERLSLIAGARYNVERKTGAFRAPLAGAVTNQLSGEAQNENLSPRLIARYAIDPGTNVYASWSRGFKSGTFNTTAVSVAPTSPEQLDSFEVGFKTARGAFSFDASAFYYDWRDIQVARFDPTIPGGNIIFNAAAAEVYGGEAQLSIQPARGLSLRLRGAYTHGRYTDFPSAIVSAPRIPGSDTTTNATTAQDWSGVELIRAPTFTGTANMSYDMPTGIGAFRFDANLFYTSRFLPNTARISALTGRPDLVAPAYALVNGTISYQPDDATTIALYARNLFDKQYILGTDASAFGDWRLYGEPRVVGVRLSYAYR